MCLVFIIVLLFPQWGCNGGKEAVLPASGKIKLRHTFETLAEAPVRNMIRQKGFYDRRWNKSGGFPNRFKLKTISGDPIVTDSVTGLTWHQSGTPLPLDYKEAQRWLINLNKEIYAGYSDWRFPTLEEALSLMERKAIQQKPTEAEKKGERKSKKYHIDPIFSSGQYSTWTGDDYSEIRAWSVSYNYGRVFKMRFLEQDFLRPVRTGTAD